MAGATFLVGDSVELRTVEEDDLDFLRETTNHPDVRRSVGNSAPTNAHAEREWFESMSTDDDAQFLVRADGERVGTVGLHEFRDGWGRAEAGYFFHPDHWGNGYATEAVELVCGYGFRERRLNKVAARTFAFNEASGRVLEKVGFQHEGTLREEAFEQGEYVDLEYWGLLAEEYER
ncbi:GNAT family N-acetyltransferase [Halomarina oriensis]|uniref:GNAT family N-acetyltransferase n=1 Tax=Halomarina oriensis TaxID=671145 RepID=A0A6B0GFL5_9EURY|nr:GNAT family protein [Halomarina oriensis]MWG33300.1 GNAT family N-acetyltransferase [Halomarina oriensis]